MAAVSPAVILNFTEEYYHEDYAEKPRSSINYYHDAIPFYPGPGNEHECCHEP